LRKACLEQLDKCLRTTLNNLTPQYIRNYILRNDKINILVIWNGHSNKNILNRLGLTEFPILNITCYDKLFNQNFTLQLEKLHSKEIIYEIEIGIFDKKRDY